MSAVSYRVYGMCGQLGALYIGSMLQCWHRAVLSHYNREKKRLLRLHKIVTFYFLPYCPLQQNCELPPLWANMTHKFLMVRETYTDTRRTHTNLHTKRPHLVCKSNCATMHHPLVQAFPKTRVPSSIAKNCPQPDYS